MGKPESTGVKVFYAGEAAEKYDQSTGLKKVQSRITQRCLEILNAPDNALILDIGCGSGMSTEQILDAGNRVVGVDISVEMLRLAQKRVSCIEYEYAEAQSLCDFAAVDIGHGLPFKTASFDHAVSVSVLQWLLVQEDCRKCLSAFFYTLYDVLKSDGIAVLQYYPETDKHVDMVMKAARKNGFAGGTLQENTDSKKKKKTYLILEMARSRGLSSHVPEVRQKTTARVKNRDLSYRDWVLKKKNKRVERGFEVPRTSKYTGRRRG